MSKKEVNNNFLEFDEEGSPLTQTTSNQQLTEEEIRNNPFVSLVEYNMGRGSPVSQFFNTFDENAKDPFKAATNLSIGFSTKMQGVNEETKRSHLQFVINTQAQRLSSALDSYNHEIQRATGYTLNTKRIDTYKNPSGFISRPTQYDTYSLLASEQAQNMNLRMSIFQVQEVYTIAGINQRKAKTDLITQSFINSDYLGKNLSETDTQRSMKVLVGNDVSLNLLQKNKKIDAYGVTMPQSSYLHAKVGYLYNNEGVNTAFISTQNITSALSRSHTTEEMLVLRRGDIFRSFSQNPASSKNPELIEREAIRATLINEIKAVTDAIYKAAKDQQKELRRSSNSLLETTRESHNQTLKFREKVIAKAKQNFTGLNALDESKRSLFVGDEIQRQILKRVQDAANDNTSNTKVVLSIQYLENIFYTDTNVITSDYQLDISKPLLRSLKTLAEQKRLSFATSASSFAPGQGLFALLDEYHAGKITGESREVLATLLENNSFSLLPTKFAHSKSFAILNQANELEVYGIGSANFSRNAHLNNVEATLILDKPKLSGLTNQEQKEIASYYYFGVSNFGREGQQGSFTESRGSDLQTKELISLLTKIGGKESRERISDEPFIFSRKYDINRKGMLSGLDIQIPALGADSKGYSFSVTVGQEFGVKGYQSVVYLSKNNRVINGMIYNNDSKEVLQLYEGVELAPGETRQFGALEVVAGLITTMQHTMKFEASSRSLQIAIASMSLSARQQALSNVLGSLAQQHAQNLGLLDWTEAPGLGLDKTFQALKSKSLRKRNLFQRLMGSPPTFEIEKVLSDLSSRLELPLAESSLGVENTIRLSERASRIKEIIRADKANYSSAELQGLSSNIVKRLDTLLMSSLGNEQTATLYHDLLRLVVKEDGVAKDLYNRSQQIAKRELFSQQTSAFMQPHELRYSFGQALYKTPVFGINDELYNLAKSQGTLGFILSPHALRHGESLGGSYLRAIADSVRFTERDLYKNQGGIYKAEGGAATIRDTVAMLSTMRGIAILNKEDYVTRVLQSFKDSGLTNIEADKRTKELEEEVFKLLKVRGISSSNLFYFPYRVTEQISGRLKNLQSGRPVEAASREFGMYADTLGVFGSTADPLQLEQMLAGSIFTSLPEHQFKYLQTLLTEHDNNPTKVLNYIKRNIHGDSMSLVRGFLGGSSPRRVLQSMGISTMSDFAYLNEDYQDTSGRPEYALLHKTTMTLDAARLQGNTSFQQLVREKLTKGVTFLAKDTLIKDASLNTLLETNVLNLLKDMNIEGLEPNLSFYEKMQKVDAETRKSLEQAISFQFETVKFKSLKGSFYFKKGVHSAAIGQEGSEERLASKKIIGQLEESKGYFTINGLYEYLSLGSQQKATQLLKFKLPAVSQRVYRGVTILHEDPRISQTGSSTITLELETSTRRDIMSGIRYGSDTSKGPNYVLAGELFRTLDTDNYSGTKKELLPERVRNQSIFAILSPSQIKGFNFEQGLMLIEERGPSNFLEFVKGDQGGAAVAEGLALMMLGEESDNTTISNLLGKHLKNLNKEQAPLALLRPDKSKYKGLPTRGSGDNISDATRATYQIFGELSSLALPEFLKDHSLSVSQALVKTVALALQQGSEADEARKHLKNRAINIFEEVRARSQNALGDFDHARYIFSDSFDSRSASVLAYLVKAGQDLLGDIDTEGRLKGSSISEINPAYFIGEKGKSRYLGQDTDADPRTRNAMLASVRRVASGLGIHLPTPEEILSSNDRERLEKKLEYGLAQANAMLRFNRFLEFGIEQLPSKIAVAVGMQNMTKLEGQYALELSKRQLGLFTNTIQEKQDILSIQQAVLLLGGLMEGQLPDPYRASTLYGLKVINLASDNEALGISKSMRFATTFLSNFSRVAQKTLPTVVGGERGYSSPLAKDAVLAHIYSTEAESNLLSKMGLVRQLAGGVVMPSFQDAEYGTDYRRRQIERYILEEVKVDPDQRKAIKNEVISILNIFKKNYGRDQALEPTNLFRNDFIKNKLKESVRTKAVEAHKAKETLIAPLSYYESFFTNLTTSVYLANERLLDNLSTQENKIEITDFITDDLLRNSGVYEHYQADINRRISASQGTELGMEYLQYGMEVLKNVSQSQSQTTDESNKQRAKDLYESISRTKRLVLPSLIGHGMNEGKHTVSYAPTTTTSPNQGLLLGLDLMQKVSLVFQGQSHAALTTQVALSEHLTSSYSLLQKLSQDASKGKTTDLNDYELEQYRRLEFLMRESVETTAQLLNNQETIRQAATDRLKLSGMSAIAMSSLLLADDEVAYGTRFTEVTQRGSNLSVKATLKRSREKLVRISKTIQNLDDSIKYLEQRLSTRSYIQKFEAITDPEGEKSIKLISSGYTQEESPPIFEEQSKVNNSYIQKFEAITDSEGKKSLKLISAGYTSEESPIIFEVHSKVNTGTAFAKLRYLKYKNIEIEATRRKMQELVSSARQNKTLTQSEYIILESFLQRNVADQDGTVTKKGYVSQELLTKLGLVYETPSFDIESRNYQRGLDVTSKEIKTGHVIQEKNIRIFEDTVSKKLEKEQSELNAKIAENEAVIKQQQERFKRNKDLVILKKGERSRALDSLTKAINEQRKAYHLQKYGVELQETEFVTKAHTNSLIEGYNVADTTEFLDYTTRLITSRNIKDISKVNIRDRAIVEDNISPFVISYLKDRTRVAIEEIESLSNSASTNVRQGAPYGSSLIARSGTALLNIVGVEGELSQRAKETETLIRPGSRESSTLMLLSALGMHYTQLGDNDGDSFQGAITKLADVTRRIQQQQDAINNLTANLSNLQHDKSFNESQLKEVRDAEIEDANKNLSLLVQHKTVLEEEQKQVRAESKQRAKLGLRAFTTTYTAIPSEMMGEGGVFSDESLQSFVKQYRDTLDGIYGNTKHAVNAIGYLNNDLLSKLELTKKHGMYRVSKIEGYTENRQNKSLYDSVRREFNYYYQSLKNRSSLQSEQEVIQAIINQQAIVANTNAALSANNDKRLASAMGSILDEQGIEQIQSILGASGTGLLGSTYNTVVPLVALKMGEIASQKALRGNNSGAYRMAMAAGLMTQINNLKNQAINNPELKNLIQQLEQRRDSYFNNGETLSTRLRLIEGQRQLEAAMRFVTTTQQFLRDAGIKPKEPKTGERKTTMLEEADSYTLPVDDLREYGINLPEGEETVRGLSNILGRLTGDAKTIKTNRENILTRFLGDRVGNDLDIYLGQGRPVSDIDTKQAKAFAALKLMTEYVSGNFEDTSAMIQQSVFKDILQGAQKTERYLNLSSDQFIPKFIADLTSGFQSGYILNNVIEIENRLEFAKTGKEVQKLYGINKDGTTDSTAIDLLVDNKKRELLLGVTENSSENKDLEAYLTRYRQEQEGRQEAIAKATSGLTDDFKIFEEALKATVNKTIEYDRDNLEKNIVELKGLHDAFKQIREGGLPSNLEQDLSLYSTAFAQQLGAGKIDSNIWMGFYAQALPEIARIASESTEASHESKAGFFSMLGLENTSVSYDITNDSSEELSESLTKAATYSGLDEEGKLELAKQYTKYKNPTQNYANLDTELQELGERGKYLSPEAEKVLINYHGEEGEDTDYRIGLEAIKGLELNTSAAEYVANQSAFSYTMSKLNQEYTNLVAEQAANKANTEVNKEVRQELNIQYENAINSIQETIESYRQDPKSVPRINNLDSISQTVQNIQEQLNRNLTETVNNARRAEVSRVSRESKRSHSMSEVVSVLAVPALFALMQNRASASEQAIEMLSNTTQAYLSSTAVVGGQEELVKTAEKLRVARIRSNLSMGGGSTESLLTGIAFESIFHTSSLVSNKVMETVETRGGKGFAATPIGRLTGEVIGGLVGMSLAGILTNRRTGLPGESVTDQDIADRIIQGIKQSTREAAERFSEQIIAQTTIDYEEEEGATLSSSSDYNNNSGFLSAMELDELTGVTITTYEGDEIPTYMEG